MGYVRKGSDDLEHMVKNSDKKYVRYDEGARLFSLGRHGFEDLARKAGAVYKIRKVALVDIKAIEAYLEKNCKVGD